MSERLVQHWSNSGHYSESHVRTTFVNRRTGLLIVSLLWATSLLLQAQSQALGKLNVADGSAGDSFGKDLAVQGNTALDGETALVGSHLDDDNGPDSGAAYVFRLDQTSGLWIETQKLTAPGGAPGDVFARRGWGRTTFSHVDATTCPDSGTQEELYTLFLAPRIVSNVCVGPVIAFASHASGQPLHTAWLSLSSDAPQPRSTLPLPLRQGSK